MIYFLFQSYFDEHGLLLRLAGAAVISFVTVLLMGPRMIRFLIREKLGDRPEFNHADLNELARHKSRTPTMGGILIVLAIFISVILFADLRNMYIRMALLALFWLGGLGAVDDWIKLRHSAGRSTRDGLKMWEKIVFQISLAAMLSVFMRRYGQNVPTSGFFYFPFAVEPIKLSLAAFVIITVLTMVSSSNAVNLTDGMDGLACGCVAIVAGVFLILAWITGHRDWPAIFDMPRVRGSAEMTILCVAMIGSSLGFLWYNANPAQVFMGDTGSLPLGGLLGYVAVVTRQELLLVIAGGVFVMEAGSVILQVGYFKMTRRRSGKGRRLFRVAPIHHHFHLGGWAESKVVVRFWLLNVIFAALALATLKLR